MEFRRFRPSSGGQPSLIMSYHLHTEELISSFSKLEGARNCYEKGQLLFRSGESPQSITLIHSGSLRLGVEPMKGRGRVDRFEFLQNRKIWGLQETILEGTYQWDGWAEERLETKQIPCYVLLNHLKSNPMLRFKLMSLFAKEVAGLHPHFE